MYKKWNPKSQKLVFGKANTINKLLPGLVRKNET